MKRSLEAMKLLADPSRTLMEPWTQDPPVRTEDMLLEEQAALDALGKTQNISVTQNPMRYFHGS